MWIERIDDLPRIGLPSERLSLPQVRIDVASPWFSWTRREAHHPLLKIPRLDGMAVAASRNGTIIVADDVSLIVTNIEY